MSMFLIHKSLILSLLFLKLRRQCLNPFYNVAFQLPQPIRVTWREVR